MTINVMATISYSIDIPKFSKFLIFALNSPADRL